MMVKMQSVLVQVGHFNPISMSCFIQLFERLTINIQVNLEFDPL